jgi:hypothetical protein
MLPDFTETKHLFSRFFQTYMRRKMREMSPFGMVQVRHYHDGRAMKVVRDDQSESKSDMQRLSTELHIKLDEIEGLTLNNVIQKFDVMIADMVSKQANLVRERIGSEMPESQTIDAKGRKLDAELVLEMKEKMQIQFNPDGTQQEIFFDGHLFTPEAIAAVKQEFQNSPELQKRHEDLMTKKREEWRAREADRKLVG